MQVVTSIPTPSSSSLTARPTAPAPAVEAVRSPGVTQSSAWTNPAAAAAMRSSVEMLQNIETGIVKNIDSVQRVRTFAADLHATSDTFSAASDAITNDGMKENDAFLPMIGKASFNVNQVESRLNDKNLAATWPAERGDILSSIRNARILSNNVAHQLDPTNPA